MRSIDCVSADGFSLIEALIATLLIASAVVGLAHLVAVAAEQSQTSRRATSALTVAQTKLEQLRRASWTYAQDGSRISSPRLTSSPAESLREDSAGYVDFVDAFGEIVAPESSVVPSFARRWSVAPLDASDPDTLILHVCAFHVRAREQYDDTAAACVAAIRTRKP